MKLVTLRRLCGLAASLFVAMPGWSHAAEQGVQPNVLLIISDDQGWADYGFMGHPHIATPRLDRLAAESLTFRRGYSPVPLCRPSLASIATGLYPHQHGVTGNDPDLSPLQFMVVDRTPEPTHRRDANAWAILFLYDLDGRELWRRRMQPGESCIATRLVRWLGPDQSDCTLVYGVSVDQRGPGKPARIYNGQGEVVDELPLQVGPAAGETDFLSDCYGMAADVWGDGREEVLLFGSRGFSIYANTRPLEQASLYNMTLYPGM